MNTSQRKDRRSWVKWNRNGAINGPQTSRSFHLGDVLSVILDRNLSTFDGVQQLVSFMTGEEAWTHQIPRLCEVCAPALLEQFPALADPHIDLAVGALKLNLEQVPAQERRYLVLGWLWWVSTGEYGNPPIPLELMVKPLRVQPKRGTALLELANYVARTEKRAE